MNTRRVAGVSYSLLFIQEIQDSEHLPRARLCEHQLSARSRSHRATGLLGRTGTDQART